MPVTNISPNPDNYYSGKGVMKFKKEGETEYRDMGDVPSFEVTPNVTRLEHYSSRFGIRAKDLSLIAQRQMTCRVIMDEITADNLAMTLMSSVATPAAPGAGYDYSGNIMDAPEVKGALRFVGTNDVGARIQMDLPFVTFAPNTAINLIQEQIGNLEVTGEVAIDPATGSFGKWYWNITEEIV